MKCIFVWGSSRAFGTITLPTPPKKSSGMTSGTTPIKANHSMHLYQSLIILVNYRYLYLKV